MLSVVLLSVVLGGCGAADDTTASPIARVSTPSVQQSGIPAIEGPAPASDSTDPPTETRSEPAASARTDLPDELDFTATTIDGATFSGVEVAGLDTLFYFWAPWCAICRATAPALADVAAGRDDVRLITVGGSSRSLEEMADFVSDTGLDDFTNVADTTGAIWTRFGVTYQYTYVFVDDNGNVEVVTGPLDESELVERFDALAAS